MLTKEKVEDSLSNLPEKFTLDELIEKIILIQKIEEGIQDADNGNTFSTKEAKERLSKWFS